MNDDDLREAMYAQDCQSWRHQDVLQWSRFQTAATIEAGMLYGLYQTAISISAREKAVFAVFTFLLVLIVSLLALKDNLDARSLLNRAISVEDQVGRLQQVRSLWAPRFITGTVLLRIAVVLINAFNVLVVVRFLYAAG
jgi:hypothetical protein